MAIFVSREDGIWNPQAPVDVLGLVGLQMAPGHNGGLRLGSVGLKWGSSIHWVQRYVKEGSGKGHLSPWVALLGNVEKAPFWRLCETGNCFRAPLLVLWARCTRRPWKQASVFIGAPIGVTWSRDSYTRDFERKVRFCSYLEPLFIWDSKKCEKEGFGSRHLALHRGTWRGGGGSFTGDFLETCKRRLWKWFPPPQAMQGVPGGRMVLLGIPEDMYKKALEEAISIHRVLVGEPEGLRGSCYQALWETGKNRL